MSFFPAATITIAAGGTGASTAAGALANLNGAAVAGDIGGTSASPTVVSTHLTAALPVAQGGTGQTVAPAASKGFLPANPATTTSTSEVMMGLADSGSQTTPVQFTPAVTGILLITVTGYSTSATATTGNTVGPRYGTVAGPATTVAAGSTGGEISQIASWSSPSAGVLDVASTTGYATSGTIWVAASGSTVAQVTYTGTSGGNSFTGCAYVSGSATGTVSTGGAVNGSPQNGTPVVGTRFGTTADALIKPPGVGQYASFAFAARLALVAGTAYWFDLALQTGNASDAASVANVAIMVAESLQ